MHTSLRPTEFPLSCDRNGCASSQNSEASANNRTMPRRSWGGRCRASLHRCRGTTTLSAHGVWATNLEDCSLCLDRGDPAVRLDVQPKVKRLSAQLTVAYLAQSSSFESTHTHAHAALRALVWTESDAASHRAWDVGGTTQQHV